MPNDNRLERLTALPPLSALRPEALLRPQDVAAYLGTDLRRLANERHARRGVPFLKLGSSVRYRAGDLLAFIEGASS